jgi:hypothetical protein
VKLEDEPDGFRAHNGEPVVGEAGDLLTGDADRAARRPVEASEMFSSVDFPEPDCPMIATNSPASTRISMPCSTGTVILP